MSPAAIRKLKLHWENYVSINVGRLSVSDGQATNQNRICRICVEVIELCAQLSYKSVQKFSDYRNFFVLIRPNGLSNFAVYFAWI